MYDNNVNKRFFYLFSKNTIVPVPFLCIPYSFPPILYIPVSSFRIRFSGKNELLTFTPLLNQYIYNEKPNIESHLYLFVVYLLFILIY